MAKLRKKRGGSLRHTIDIKSVSKTDDVYGDSPIVLETFAAKVRCNIQTITSTKGSALRGSGETEVVDGGAVFRIDLRYRQGISKQHRIVWGERSLDITGINEDEKHTGWMHLFARERDLD